MIYQLRVSKWRRTVRRLRMSPAQESDFCARTQLLLASSQPRPSYLPFFPVPELPGLLKQIRMVKHFLLPITE